MSATPDSELSFVDLLTCGVVGLIVVSLILACQIAEGGSAPISGSSNSIVRENSAPSDRIKEGAAQTHSPQFVLGEFIVSSDASTRFAIPPPTYRGFDPNISDQNSPRVLLTKETMGSRTIWSAGFSFLPPPPGVLPTSVETAMEFNLPGSWAVASEILDPITSSPNDATIFLAAINRWDRQRRLSILDSDTQISLRKAMEAVGAIGGDPKRIRALRRTWSELAFSMGRKTERSDFDRDLMRCFSEVIQALKPTMRDDPYWSKCHLLLNRWTRGEIIEVPAVGLLRGRTQRGSFDTTWVMVPAEYGGKALKLSVSGKRVATQ